MKKHGCKMLLIIIAAVLCLFSAGTVILGLRSSTADAPAEASDKAPAGNAESTAAGQAAQAPEATNNDVPDKASSSESIVPLHKCPYFNEKDFLKSVNQAEINAANNSNKAARSSYGTVKGGILPHHLLAAKMIASFFKELSLDPPATIIMIGPNHKLTGINSIQTSSTGWSTAYGTLEADRELTGILMEKTKASESNKLIENEHSISALVPYIKYYMPDTKIVPITLYGSYTREQSEKLGALLSEIVLERPDIFILASIDFSHYLEVAQADKMDEISLDAINSWDIDKLSKMGNDNLDSPPSIISLLSAMDTIGATDIEVTGHSNSSRITGGGYDYTTSYYTMFFRVPD